MKVAIFVAVYIITYTMVLHFTDKPASICSDYLLLGRTNDKCLTDRKLDE